jgi:hypothetical protein
MKNDLNQLQYWFWKNLTIYELSTRLEKILHTETFFIDRENVWEYMTTQSLNGLYKCNISRIHNRANQPFVLHISSENSANLIGTEYTLGEKIAQHLQTEVFWGEAKCIKNQEFEEEWELFAYKSFNPS